MLVRKKISGGNADEQGGARMLLRELSGTENQRTARSAFMR
jgi:hypothetical protein